LQKNRETWVDVAKGLGIILVIIGHSGNEFAGHYFFWFHMPLFFILSGYTFKEISNKRKLISWIKRRFLQLMVPYISFGLLIILAINFDRIISGNFGIVDFLIECLKLGYGGEKIGGAFAVFWFITCLLVTQVVFASITLFFKSIKTQIAIVSLLFIIGHIQSIFLTDRLFPLPWNFDVALVSTFYFAVGFYFKKMSGVKLFSNVKYGLISVLLLFLLVIGDILNVFSYSLDMKKHFYHNLFFDAIIPLIISAFICFISYHLVRLRFSNALNWLGLISLPIMYLHFPINVILKSVFGEYNWIVFSVNGFAFSVLFYLLIVNNLKFADFLFLGNMPKVKDLEKISA